MRMLIVEDEKDLCNILKKRLQKDYTIDVCMDGDRICCSRSVGVVAAGTVVAAICVQSGYIDRLVFACAVAGWR